MAVDNCDTIAVAVLEPVAEHLVDSSALRLTVVAFDSEAVEPIELEIVAALVVDVVLAGLQVVVLYSEQLAMMADAESLFRIVFLSFEMNHFFLSFYC